MLSPGPWVQNANCVRRNERDVHAGITAEDTEKHLSVVEQVNNVTWLFRSWELPLYATAQPSPCQGGGITTLVCSGLNGGVPCWDCTLKTTVLDSLVRDLRPAHRREGEEVIRSAAVGGGLTIPGTQEPSVPHARRSAARWVLVQTEEGLPWWLSSKEPAQQCRRRRFDSWVGKRPWRRKWQPTPVFLPGKSHGQRNLVGYSLWGRTESDTTE